MTSPSAKLAGKAVPAPTTPHPLLARLVEAAGRDAVITGPDAVFYYTDVYRRLETPLAVVRPETVEALSAVVREAVEADIAIYPRGGGASYTDGYLPTRPQAIVLDTGRLNRIVEINETDAWVTVEAGVTWAQLKAALDPLGLRTPFFGPFSGLAATVGGSMSQNSLSHGSGAHGVSAQSLLGLDVVIASGEVIRTGSAARGSAPYARFYGPDLAGLFTGDCGAFGVKARLTLPLLRRKPAFGCASFAFTDIGQLSGTMRRLAMDNLDDEHFAIDAALSKGQIARQNNAGAVLDMAKAVFATAPSVISGAAQLVKMAVSGVKALERAELMLHVIVEGVSQREVKAKLARLGAIMAPGLPIPNTVPAVVRAMPFAPLFNTLGPAGERWVPLHGVLPHSKVVAFHEALQNLYQARAEDMRRLGVWSGGMFETVNPSGFLYEVALYWPGAQTEFHQSVIPADYLKALPAYPDDAETQAFVAALKADITDLYDSFGATHFQLGKAYPYASVLAKETLGLLKAIKASVDPKGLINPGALEL